MLDIKNNRIVLVSHSEEKAKMIEKAGISCFPFPSLIKEREVRSNPTLTGRELALKLSEKRAADVGNVYPDLYVVCVEQVIECNGKILKKPDCMDDIFNDFKTLNGQKYTLHTAVTIYQNHKKKWQEIESLQLTRKHMTEEQIKDFVMKYGPSMFGVLGSVRLDEFPDMVEEKDLDLDVIKGLPIKNIVHFFKTLRE